MNQHPFTAALAEQHRTDLMKSAQSARDRRRATAGRGHALTLRWRRLQRPIAARALAPVTALADVSRSPNPAV